MTSAPVMSDEARRLAADNVRLAWKFARKLDRRHPGLRDDIESAAMLGLCKAAAAFDRGRGVAFSSFAYACMRWEVRRLMESPASRRHTLFCDSPLADEEVAREGVADPRAEVPGDRMDREAAFADLHGALEALTERERFVLRRRMFDGLTLVEAAAELSREEGIRTPLSKERIRQIEARAMERLRSSLRGTTALAMA